LEKAGHEVNWVNVYRADILEQLKGCDGFMWRWAHFGGMGQIARRLLPVVERELGLVVYPDQNTCWHYDDKIAQAHGGDIDLHSKLGEGTIFIVSLPRIRPIESGNPDSPMTKGMTIDA